MIHQSEISDEFAGFLAKAGWVPERLTNIDEWVKILRAEGFKPSGLALSILESVGGLTVETPPMGNNPYGRRLVFDPVSAASGEKDRTETWEEQLGIDLFPIGLEDKFNNVVWVGSDNAFYIGREYSLYLLGNNFREAMDMLICPPKDYVVAWDYDKC